MAALAVVNIPESRNYWFVRTQSGKWYDEFISGRYIGINWNEITLDFILNAETIDSLHKSIKQAFPKQQRHGLTATHMVRFAKEMNIGDVVIIPSENGTEFMFGEIEGNAYTHTDKFEVGKCPYTKRRKVNWLKRIGTNLLDPALKSIKYAQPAVNSLNTYAELIDRELGGFLYTKGNLGYVVVRVEEQQAVRAKDLADFLTSTLAAVQKIDPDVNIDEITIQLNVQSPGPIAWVASVGVIFLLASAIYVSTPGDYNIKIEAGPIKVSSGIKTEGLLEAYRKYDAQKHSQEMEKLKYHQEKLGIKLPEVSNSSTTLTSEQK